MKTLKQLSFFALLFLGVNITTVFAQISSELVKIKAPVLRPNFVYNGPACDDEYTQVFRDDFSGNSLDEGKWIIHEGPDTECAVDEEHGFYSRNRVNVAGGNLELSVLKIEPTFSGCLTKDGSPRIREHVYEQAQISSNDSQNKDNGGCWKYGKYCIRTKVADPKKDVRSAFWFFGWAGEPDVFEFLDNSNKGKKRPKSNFHMMHTRYLCTDPNGFNGETHYDNWIIDNCCEPKVDTSSTCTDCPLSPNVDKTTQCRLLTDIEESQSHEDGTDYTAGFHEFCFEWTPFKMVWSIDGKEVRSVYRLFANHQVATNIHGEYVGVFGNPIECLQPGASLTNVVENMWFPKIGHHLNLLLSLIVDNGNANGNGPYEMLVDYVDVEQMNVPKTELLIASASETLCLGEEMTIKLESNDQIAGLLWDIPANLEIVSTNNADNSIVVRTIANPTLSSGKPEVVTAIFPNPNSCHDLEKEIEVWIGAPEHPEVEIEMLGCTGLIHFSLPGQINGQVNWQISSPTGTILNQSTTPQNGVLVEISDQKPHLLYYELTIENDCGELTLSGHFLTEDCSDNTTFRFIKITPNPTAGPTIAVELENFEPSLFPSEGLELSIVDEYLNPQQSHTAFSNFETVDISQLANGSYYLYTQVEGTAIYSSKFLVMK